MFDKYNTVACFLVMINSSFISETPLKCRMYAYQKQKQNSKPDDVFKRHLTHRHKVMADTKTAATRLQQLPPAIAEVLVS
jgi:hypothetical protein